MSGITNNGYVKFKQILTLNCIFLITPAVFFTIAAALSGPESLLGLALIPFAFIGFGVALYDIFYLPYFLKNYALGKNQRLILKIFWIILVLLIIYYIITEVILLKK